MLEGKNVNLKIVEKDNLPLLADWSNNSEFSGKYVSFPQQSLSELTKKYDSLTPDTRWFFIEKKDGTKIGTMFHFPRGDPLEIGYALIPSERSKGYCTEAVEIIVDYLFLSKEIVRVQAIADAENIASQKVLKKAGFKKEGIIRKNAFIKGEWRDGCLHSILRDEWKEPKILTKKLEKITKPSCNPGIHFQSIILAITSSSMYRPFLKCFIGILPVSTKPAFS